ncbi:hypothetical protein AB0G04_36200 [Actinoplanes sp. NPDC023801]|uniref:hypothetical protein n=1 Tax=Actinoplanes sp. NPDC023801 TaxID=3154595 RepID=UPI00340EAA81
MTRRTLLLAAVTIVVTALIAGITMFFVRGGVRAAETGMGSCSAGTTYDCIPNLKADDLTAALQNHGFTCDNPQVSRGCFLEIGDTLFTVDVGRMEGGINRLSTTMRLRADTEPSAGAMALLRWVGGIPFAHDRVAAAEVDAWIVNQVAAKKNVDATIAGYSYDLESKPGEKNRRTLRLDIQQKVKA